MHRTAAEWMRVQNESGATRSSRRLFNDGLERTVWRLNEKIARWIHLCYSALALSLPELSSSPGLLDESLTGASGTFLVTAAGDGESAAVGSCGLLVRFVLRFFVDFLVVLALVDLPAAFFVVFLAAFFVDFFAAFLVDLFAEPLELTFRARFLVAVFPERRDFFAAFRVAIFVPPD